MVLQELYPYTGLSPTTTESSVEVIQNQNGIDFLRLRIAGTTTGEQFQLSFESGDVIEASSGEIWTLSAFVARQSGSLSNILSIMLSCNENDRRGIFLSFHNGQDVAKLLPKSLSVSSQFSLGITNGHSSTSFIQPFLTLMTVPFAPIDITLDIGWPELKLGPLVDSPIRTTGTSFMRSADNVTNLDPLLSAKTAVIAGIALQGTSSANQVIWQWDDGTPKNRICLIMDAAQVLQALVVSDDLVQIALPLGTVEDTKPFKVAFAWTANDFAAIATGGGIQVSRSGTLPLGLTTQRLGSASEGAHGNIYLTRQTLFSQRQPNRHLVLFIS